MIRKGLLPLSLEKEGNAKAQPTPKAEAKKARTVPSTCRIHIDPSHLSYFLSDAPVH
jgi:hypothetical protein